MKTFRFGVSYTSWIAIVIATCVSDVGCVNRGPLLCRRLSTNLGVFFTPKSSIISSSNNYTILLHVSESRMRVTAQLSLWSGGPWLMCLGIVSCFSNLSVHISYPIVYIYCLLGRIVVGEPVPQSGYQVCTMGLYKMQMFPNVDTLLRQCFLRRKTMKFLHNFVIAIL